MYGEVTTVPALVDALGSATPPNNWPIRLNRTIDGETGETIAPKARAGSRRGSSSSLISIEGPTPWLHGVTVRSCTVSLLDTPNRSSHGILTLETLQPQAGKEADFARLKSDDGVYKNGTFFIAETDPNSPDSPA